MEKLKQVVQFLTISHQYRAMLRHQSDFWLLAKEVLVQNMRQALALDMTDLLSFGDPYPRDISGEQNGTMEVKRGLMVEEDDRMK